MITMSLKQLIGLLNYTDYDGEVYLDVVDSGNIYRLNDVDDDDILYAGVVGINLQPDCITISVSEQT